MKNVIFTAAIVVVLAVGVTAHAQLTLQGILFGEPPPAEPGTADIEVPGLKEPVGLMLGLSVGPDVDNKNNELNLVFSMRYNQFEIGPMLMMWPGLDDADEVWGIYAIRHLTYEPVLIGTPFVGFKTTLTGKADGMYAFLSGFDTQLAENFFIRTTVEFRNFKNAMAFSHADESDEIIAQVGPVFRF